MQAPLIAQHDGGEGYVQEAFPAIAGATHPFVPVGTVAEGCGHHLEALSARRPAIRLIWRRDIFDAGGLQCLVGCQAQETDGGGVAVQYVAVAVEDVGVLGAREQLAEERSILPEAAVA